MPIVNPLASAPFFLGPTTHVSADKRHALAGRIALNGFLLLLGSMAPGPWPLSAFLLMCIGIECIWNGYTALTAVSTH